MTPTPEKYLEHLQRFGIDSFRPGQLDVIQAVMDGEDCLCIMPTGGGKSLCYQLPAIVRDGVTLVVSPLIALMKDQVDSLLELGIPATYINSALQPAEQFERLEGVEAGRYDLVYVAPERFRSPRFRAALKEVNVDLLAVDEAHCVSEWGHDFRPDYARLAQFRAAIGNPQTIALTATATEDVRVDITKQLALQSPRTFVAGFARKNLHCAVEKVKNQREKEACLVSFLQSVPGSGIIYVSARKRCDEVAVLLGNSKESRRVGIYHAGMMPDERRQAQEDFMSGRTDIVVATVAFGMGIDKSDVRFVVHYNMPGTLEGYYQEAGRAGRDGLPSKCAMLYAPGDKYIQEFFIENNYPSQEVVAKVYRFLCGLTDDPIEMTQHEIQATLDLPVGGEGVGVALQLLEKAGVLERHEPHQSMAIVRIDSEHPTLVDLLPKQAKVRRKVLQAIEKIVNGRRGETVYFQPRAIAVACELELSSVKRVLRELRELDDFHYVPPFRGRALHVLRRDQLFEELQIDFTELEARKEVEYQKLERVIRYAQTHRCRQLEVLDYFGDPSSEKCGTCDNCVASGTPQTNKQTLDTTAISEEGLQVIQKALAGVARTHGRYGKQIVAQMLFGSKSAKMTRYRLDQLSTYGLLKRIALGDISTLLDVLIGNRLLEQSDIDRFRPVINLTTGGHDVMRGTTSLPADFVIPRSLLVKIQTGSPPEQLEEAAIPTGPPADRAVLERLRAWRREVADEKGWPAYRILTNATAEQLAREKPTTLEELLSVNGIGEAKIRDYGETLLELLVSSDAVEQDEEADSQESDEASVEPAVARVDPPEASFETAPSISNDWDDDEPEVPADLQPVSEEPPKRIQRIDTVEPVEHVEPAALDDPATKPSHFWTWRLLQSGFSPSECAAIRGLTSETVLDHAVRAANQGLDVNAGWFLDGPTILEIERVVGNSPAERIRPLLGKLPATVGYEQVQLFLKCRANRQNQQNT